MKRTISVAAVSAATLAALLTGCTQSSPTTLSSTPSASSDEAAPTTNSCVDGELTVTDATAAADALKTGCDSVYLLTSGADVTLGPTEDLVIEGQDNTVHGSHLGEVSALGSGNTIEHTGDAPDAADLGDGNTLTQVEG